MREILPQVEQWLREGCQVTAATVVQVFKSAPRLPGAVMAVNSRGEVAGSVSGGCVEAAVVEEATAILASGRARMLTYGIADDQAFEVGLTCGGTIHLFAERLDWAPALLPVLSDALAAQRPVALATVTAGGQVGAKLLIAAEQTWGGLGTSGLDYAVTGEARAMLRQGITGVRHFGPEGEIRRDDTTLFIESFAPPPRMFVFGAIDFASAAVRMGKFLGYHVVLCDARGRFATPARFPEADELVLRWAHEYLAEVAVGERDAILVLTHDPKFDIPVLLEALKSPAGYIGALGSRRTHQRRQQELLEAGARPEQLARICSPVGLDIGGHTPEETAVSIAAEIIALRKGKQGGRLSTAGGRIHGEERGPVEG